MLVWVKNQIYPCHHSVDCYNLEIIISFQGDRTQVMEKRFSEFVLVAENAEAVLGAKVDTVKEGSYQLLGDVLTRFSDHCTNTGWWSLGL